MSLLFVKVAFLLLFSRIFFATRSKLPIYVAMTIVIMWGIGQSITVMAICRPFAYNWDFTIPSGKCGNRPASYITVGFFHIATDIMILIIPIPFLLKLQLGRAKKISLLAIFGLGFGYGHRSIFVLFVSANLPSGAASSASFASLNCFKSHTTTSPIPLCSALTGPCWSQHWQFSSCLHQS